MSPAPTRAVDGELADWIEANVTFPSTMVDRIVPAVTADTLDKIEQLTGVRDPAGVACEPFRQWVVEDNFVAGRPKWEKAGAELVSDVIPFEEMKLRMLNGSHSFWPISATLPVISTLTTAWKMNIIAQPRMR